MARHRDARLSAEAADVRQWAEDYTARAWAVVPLGAGKKRPFRKGLRKRQLTPKEIERFFSSDEHIGVCCVELSNPFWPVRP